VLVLFGAAIVASLVLSKTVFGRYTFALGSNEEATVSPVSTSTREDRRLRGRRPVRRLAGCSSVPAEFGQPSLGLGYELDAIAAAVIGGTSLSGGEGTILGTVIGAFIISTSPTACGSSRCRRSGRRW